jgi:hypothetical protein
MTKKMGAPTRNQAFDLERIRLGLLLSIFQVKRYEDLVSQGARPPDGLYDLMKALDEVEKVGFSADDDRKAKLKWFQTFTEAKAALQSIYAGLMDGDFDQTGYRAAVEGFLDAYRQAFTLKRGREVLLKRFLVEKVEILRHGGPARTAAKKLKTVLTVAHVASVQKWSGEFAQESEPFDYEALRELLGYLLSEGSIDRVLAEMREFASTEAEAG